MIEWDGKKYKGLKDLRWADGEYHEKKPKFECDNCKCKRYHACTCKRGVQK